MSEELKAEPTRMAFEKFHGARKNRGAKSATQFARLPDGSYMDESVQRHWWTWQNALAHPAPAGWKLVPIEPTDEMLEAAAIYRQGCQMLDRSLKTSSLYAAMLSAAPSAQEPA